MNLLKKSICTLICVSALSTAGLSAATAAVDIIPRPQSVEQTAGRFLLTPAMTIGYEAPFEKQAEYLRDRIWKATGMDLKLTANPAKSAIKLVESKKDAPAAEGYKLTVTPRSAVIAGHDAGGVFYGIQSFLQLFPAEIFSDSPARGVEWSAPAVTVTDAPARPWRGMMLDVARYYYDKEFIKEYIDMMAAYKLNKLQFHLIDDSGWRLEIKKYPRLTEVGAWAGRDNKRIGGYYTQDDIREIIEYGKTRNVEIIPEIEFPAHILSAIVAYPWLSCTGQQHEVPLQHFISRDLLCVGKQTSIDFLEDVLNEVVDLFPSDYINIGGDEAVYDRWKECPDCQALMKREGLKEASEIQGYLTNVVADMMAKKNKTVIGWEEIIQRGKVNKPVVALIWHNVGDSIQATQTGHKAILTPATHMYLDFPESSTPGEVKAATWMPPISLEKCYSMPVNDYSDGSTVLGVQGCVWSDQFIHGTVLQEILPIDENRSENYVEYLTFPRMIAISEVAWTPESRRDYNDFANRITSHYPRLDQMGYSYRVPEPHIVSMDTADGGETTFTLSPAVEGAEIRYTTDGSYPTIHSAVYTEPVTVKNKSDFHAITVVSPTHYSLPIYFAPDYSAYAAHGVFGNEWKTLQLQKTSTPVRFDVTGKISGNGSYEITVIPEKGAAVEAGAASLHKRDELLGEDTSASTTLAPGNVKTYRFTVESFEAGTPFYFTVDMANPSAGDTHGLIFVKKLD